MPFEYFQSYQADQFSFINIPKVMVTEEIFSPLSIQAKILYGMLLDRMGCAQRNKWIDEENRVYIIYPISEIAKDMNISKRKAINSMAELVGMGLVEKKHIGQGRSNVLYIKKFVITSD